MEHEIEHLLEVKGFNFKNGTDGIKYTRIHDEFLGKIGTVTGVAGDFFEVNFGILSQREDILLYPLSEWKKAIIPISAVPTHKNPPPPPPTKQEEPNELLYFKKALHFLDISFTNEKIYRKVYEVAKSVVKKGGETNIKDLLRL